MNRRAALLWLLPLCCAGCAQMVRYTDDLTDARTGRTFATLAPATFGGIVGFLVGIPVDVIALPASYLVYSTQDPVTRDQLSTFLFPSFVLWHVGTLLGVPFDLVEWAVWRAWAPDDALTPEERERRETELDDVEFPVYPVTPIYPCPAGG